MTGPPAVLTVEEAARVLRIGRSAAYEAVRAGTIPSIRVGRSLRVPRARLERELLGVLDGPVNDNAPGAGRGDAQTTVDPTKEEGSGGNAS